MALRPPRTTDSEGALDEPQQRVQPIRPVWQGALIWLIGIGVLLAVIAIAVRVFVVPALSGQSSSPSPAEARLAALQTQEALTPAPAPTRVLAPAPVPTAAAAIAPTAVPTPALTATPVVLVSAPASANATAAPTVSPELAAEVSQAYLRYFQVTADAFLKLDASGLSDVAVDGVLTALQQNIAALQSQGKALVTNVQHNFSVLSADNNQAQVADQYRDSSVFVDPTSHEPLPGQETPMSPDSAPLVRIVYQLEYVGGTWKVAGGTRYE